MSRAPLCDAAETETIPNQRNTRDSRAYDSQFPRGARPVVAYLDLLCSALIARDQPAIERLRADPRAGALPPAVRSEVDEFARLGQAATRAPIHALHCYYEHYQRERDAMTVRVLAEHARQRRRTSQIELPLSAA